MKKKFRMRKGKEKEEEEEDASTIFLCDITRAVSLSHSPSRKVN